MRSSLCNSCIWYQTTREIIAQHTVQWGIQHTANLEVLYFWSDRVFLRDSQKASWVGKAPQTFAQNMANFKLDQISQSLVLLRFDILQEWRCPASLASLSQGPAVLRVVSVLCPFLLCGHQTHTVFSVYEFATWCISPFIVIEEQ